MRSVFKRQGSQNTVRYFNESLSKEEYYTGAGTINGKWFGDAARMLKLRGDVLKDQFVRLCHNKQPNGAQWTAHNRKDRITAWDIGYDVPKSVSLAALVKGDSRIIEAFQSAVLENISLVEGFIKTRIRIDKQYQDRRTKNMVAAMFTHFLSRPIGGIEDPQLHTHVLILNGTYDEVEQKWKAIKPDDIYRHRNYLRQCFLRGLRIRLNRLGYHLNPTMNGSFEITGIKRQTIEKFSRRTRAIERIAHIKNITDPTIKGRLGAQTREHKHIGRTFKELQASWKRWLTDEERTALDNTGTRSWLVPSVPGVNASNLLTQANLTSSSSLLRSAPEAARNEATSHHYLTNMRQRE